LGQSNDPKPKHPEFEDHIARVRSFMGKQRLIAQDIQALADAGYYYVGKLLELINNLCLV